MVIFINGSFGIGKTTVARGLVARLPGSVLFDPELHGLVLQRLARPFKRIDDFQDLRAWRAGSVRLIRLARLLRPTVVVPMAFSNEAYLGEVVDGIRSFDVDTLHFCLTAPLAVVQHRLQQREGRRGPTPWQLRRAAECCTEHQRPQYAVHVATQDRSSHDVVEDMLTQLRSRAPVQAASA
ncbi:MAG TPA: AAA family ATPase [Gammaproteobacteria bacterium]|nr:AAA family ATPase [Gammaproteobacteria bacterium]